jgi:2-iminoacetate synthase ThiH
MNRAQRTQNRDNAQALSMIIAQEKEDRDQEALHARMSQKDSGAFVEVITNQFIDNAVLTITPPIL